MKKAVAFLFPGQGAFYSGALQECRLIYPCVERVIHEIDSVAKRRLGQSVSQLLWHSAKRPLEQHLLDSPDLLQLAMYGISVTTYHILESEGIEPALLMGHSFGEIPALVCAGRYSIAEGAEIVCDRIESLAAHADREGYMLAIQAGEAAVSHALQMVGDDRAVVAVCNHDKQTIVSGPGSALDYLQRLSGAMRWSSLRLNSPYAFHSPLVAGAMSDFSERLRRYPSRPLQLRVHSPILGRDYVDTDDFAEILPQHLIHPVRFGAAIRRLGAEGIVTHVECGALDALSRIAEKVMPAGLGKAAPSIGNGAAEIRQIREAIQMINSMGENKMTTNAALASVQLDEFWKAHGSNIMGYMKSELQSFLTGSHRNAPVAEIRPEPARIQDKPQDNPQDKPASKLSRDQLYNDLVKVYAEAMEYPAEVFSDTVELEAELGIDSVRQTELLGRISESYGLPPRPADFRMSDYKTMGQIVDFVHQARATPPLAMAA